MKAYYTNKPDKFSNVGNGSKLYRFNMVEVPAPSEQGEEARTQWQVDEVTVWEPLSKEKLVKVVLNEQYGQDHELKLLNEYVSAKEEVITGEEAEAAIAAYKAFAAERKALKANVEYDYEHPVEPEPTERRIVLDKSGINMNVGETVSLFSTVLPEGSDQGTHAEIDNPILTALPVEVGEFSITANSAGTCVITVTSKVYPDIYAECVVNVSAPKGK